ncbi:hypothetical protein JDV02_006810 [Purpureocillium takamizusanense]|uniref:Secreted protein n=1 Tax=Purpureocillium takamizusanense TaxID=2060973 RepID=A0A9Q8VBP8_9HYPO|nr:uncharacterized protein JDV02_006810 [Purpureocillium takamizusanense]UNI20750.1 hypothetical protein JDV02_006810 [Purpureocillium takamizusanense]
MREASLHLHRTPSLALLVSVFALDSVDRPLLGQVSESHPSYLWQKTCDVRGGDGLQTGTSNRVTAHRARRLDQVEELLLWPPSWPAVKQEYPRQNSTVVPHLRGGRQTASKLRVGPVVRRPLLLPSLGRPLAGTHAPLSQQNYCVLHTALAATVGPIPWCRRAAQR